MREPKEPTIDEEHDEASYFLEELDLRLYPAKMGKVIVSALDECGGLTSLARAYGSLYEIPERLAAALAKQGHKGELHVVVGISTDRQTIVRVEFEAAKAEEPCPKN